MNLITRIVYVALLCAVIFFVTMFVTGCQVAYSTDGQKKSVSVGFTPDYKDFKAIRDLR